MEILSNNYFICQLVAFLALLYCIDDISYCMFRFSHMKVVYYSLLMVMWYNLAFSIYGIYVLTMRAYKYWSAKAA